MTIEESMLSLLLGPRYSDYKAERKRYFDLCATLADAKGEIVVSVETQDEAAAMLREEAYNRAPPE